MTVLGIVIGVGAVIAMLAIGRGAQDSITGSISSIGTNRLFVIEGGTEEVRNPKPLTLSDAEAMADPFAAPSVIGVAPVKDHNLCRASMTTKNWYGLLGGRRNQFHQDIHGIIADVALMLRPTFVGLDGTRVLWRSGPTGGSLADVREGRTIVASTDSLAADAFGWDDLLGRKAVLRREASQFGAVQ